IDILIYTHTHISLFKLVKKRHDIEMRFDTICSELQKVLHNARRELRDAFQQDITHQREQLATERNLLVQEIEEMKVKIDRERADLKRERKVVKYFRRKKKGRVKLNIGGHNFEPSITSLS